MPYVNGEQSYAGRNAVASPGLKSTLDLNDRGGVWIET